MTITRLAIIKTVNDNKDNDKIEILKMIMIMEIVINMIIVTIISSKTFNIWQHESGSTIIMTIYKNTIKPIIIKIIIKPIIKSILLAILLI